MIMMIMTIIMMRITMMMTGRMRFMTMMVKMTKPRHFFSFAVAAF
jgi:hypothetical protein